MNTSLGANEIGRAFDPGKSFIGEALRQPTRFLNKARLPKQREFVENKNGAAKAPCGSHRSRLAAKAARLFPTYRGRPTGFDPLQNSH